MLENDYDVDYLKNRLKEIKEKDKLEKRFKSNFINPKKVKNV